MLQQMQDKKRKRPDPSSALCIKNILADNGDENGFQEQVEDEQHQQKQYRATTPTTAITTTFTTTMTTDAPSSPPSIMTFTNAISELLIDPLVQK